MQRPVSLAVFVTLCCAAALAEDPMIREFESQGYRVRVHLNDQVLRIDVPQERAWSDDGREEGQAEAAVLPRFPTHTGACLSAAALAEKAKQFDDGLYAAVEFSAQQGCGPFAGKAYLLKAVTDHVAKIITQGDPDGAAATVFAAARMGEIPLLAPAGLEASIAAAIDRFCSNALRSKPIAFYTWSRSLETIFQQDRMLQTELKNGGEIAAILDALAADERAGSTYVGYVQLVERLTNPFVGDKPDLRNALALRRAEGRPAPPRDGVYFFPPSRAHETELIKKLYGSQPIPDGFDLATEMIKRIRAGQLDLAPTKDSGWYDHQVWALEPLATPAKTPESARLRLSPEYEKQLEKLFKGILARTRETHIKQLEIPEVASALPPDNDNARREPVIIDVRPDLSVEPLATFYLRRAESYRFIRGVLETTFGADGLQAMKVWSPDGQSQGTVAEELTKMEELFLGAHVTACGQIGVQPQLRELIGATPAAISAVTASARAAFESWSADAGNDPDLGRDGRMMVPVFFDLQRGKTKVWAFLGWSTSRVSVSYEKRPRVEVFNAAGKPVPLSDDLQVVFHEDGYNLAYPVMAEVYVSQILNRAEFAAHCDKHKTRKAILENLK